MRKIMLPLATLAMGFLGGLVGFLVMRPSEAQGQLASGTSGSVTAAVNQLTSTVNSLQNGTGFTGSMNAPLNLFVLGNTSLNTVNAQTATVTTLTVGQTFLVPVLSGGQATSIPGSVFIDSADGNMYYYFNGWNLLSVAATNTQPPGGVPPAVTTNPASTTVTVGQNAVFTAAATGSPTPSVQWQVSADGGVTYTNLAGATSPTFTLVSVQPSQNGYMFQAVFSNGVGNATTSAATLSVIAALAPPVVTTNPTSTSAAIGQNATFTAAATGNPTPTVQWMVSTDQGLTWSTIAGATSPTFTLVNVTTSQNGYQFEAVFTSSQGSATSSAATLSVVTAPVVTANPASASVAAGGNVSFTAAATGTPTPTVQWQVSTNGGVTYSNVSGATSPTFTLVNASTTQNGYEFIAVFTNSGGSVNSLPATLSVNAAQSLPVITTNPSSTTVNNGQNATFTAAATGTPTPTVQWQQSTNNGNSWSNISGATSTSYSITGNGYGFNNNNGWQFRAVFTNTSGNATTTAAILTVN